MEDYIKLDKGSIQRYGIRDASGKETGEWIEIDPEDIDFPFRANECQNRHEENVEELTKRLEEIEKTCSNDGDFPTERDIARREACKEFMEKEEKAIDDFIGEGTTRKILNGRRPYIMMFNDIIDTIAQITPALKDASKKMVETVREKYKKNKEENNVI